MLINSEMTESKITRGVLADRYWVDKLDDDMFPLTYQKVEKYQ